MTYLSDIQIEVIRDSIRSGGVESVELEDDLLDHLCCAVDEGIEDDMEFDDALERAKEDLCPDGFKEIQEETTYLLTLKFKKMKKAINIFGIIGTVMILLGAFFKIKHFPGAGPLLVLGSCALIFLYIPILWWMSIKQIANKLIKVKYTAVHLAAALVFINFIFIVQNWPMPIGGRYGLLLIGVGLFFGIFLPIHLFYRNKDVALKMQPISMAVISLTVVTIVVTFSFGRVNKDMLNAFIIVNHGIEITNQSLEMKNAISYNKFEVALANDPVKVAPFKSKALEAKKMADELDAHIDALKLHLIWETGGQKLASANIKKDTMTLRWAYNKDNYDMPTYILIGEPGRSTMNKGKWSANELKLKINKYRDNLLGLISPKVRSEMILSLETSDPPTKPGGWKYTWEDENFYHLPLAATVTILAKIQTDVRIAESDVVAVLLNEVTTHPYGGFDTSDLKVSGQYRRPVN